MQLFSCQLFNMVVLFKILASRWWQASKGRAILYFATTPSPSSPEEGSFESLPKDGSSKMSFSLVSYSVWINLTFPLAVDFTILTLKNANIFAFSSLNRNFALTLYPQNM